MAQNLGTVQFSLFFYPHETLWYWTTRDDDYFPKTGKETNGSSYVIFFNNTHGSQDFRSEQHHIDFPLLVLQKSIEHSMLLIQNPKENVTYDVNFSQIWSVGSGYTLEASARNFTCGTHEYDMYGANFGCSVVFTFGFQFLGLMLFLIIAKERQKGLVRSLKSIGLYFSSYWLSYFTVFQVLILTSSLLTLIVAAIIRPYVYMLQNLDFGVLFLLIWLGVTCTVANNMFLASFLPPSGNSTSAMIGANFVGSIVLLYFTTETMNSYEWLVLVGPNGNYGYFCEILASPYNSVFDTGVIVNYVYQLIYFWMPAYHIGRVVSEIVSIQQYGMMYVNEEMYKSHTMYVSKNVFRMPVPVTVPSVSWTFGMMVLLSLVYLLLAWILSQWLQGTPIRQIILSMVPGYHCLCSPKASHRTILELHPTEVENRSSIIVHKLVKTLKKKVPILQEVSFEAQQGEVLCLIGNNGCGKSTLFNILKGIITPTSGDVSIFGRSIQDVDQHELSQFIAMCPQKDYLWNELTAFEHMMLHARFKGLDDAEAEKECNRLLSIVGLFERKNTPAHNFSGGMKRRLSAAMSMIGDFKVLLLDGKCYLGRYCNPSVISVYLEPTTGLDVVSRRAIWKLIQDLKKDKIVLLTTHSLEEADYLSDRVMILEKGQVKAMGDSLTLKQIHGHGYQIRMLIDNRIASSLGEEISKVCYLRKILF